MYTNHVIGCYTLTSFRPGFILKTKKVHGRQTNRKKSQEEQAEIDRSHNVRQGRPASERASKRKHKKVQVRMEESASKGWYISSSRACAWAGPQNSEDEIATECNASTLPHPSMQVSQLND